MGDDERLVRVLTNKHFKANGALKPTAFNLADIRSDGVSLVRVDKISVVEFQAVADAVKRAANANAVEGALTARASLLRAKIRGGKARELCVIDDPVRDDPPLPDNEAHCIAVSSVEIDEMDAKEIRAWLLTEFSEARYLSDIWQKDAPAAPAAPAAAEAIIADNDPRVESKATVSQLCRHIKRM